MSTHICLCGCINLLRTELYYSSIADVSKMMSYMIWCLVTFAGADGIKNLCTAEATCDLAVYK